MVGRAPAFSQSARPVWAERARWRPRGPRWSAGVRRHLWGERRGGGSARSVPPWRRRLREAPPFREWAPLARRVPAPLLQSPRCPPVPSLLRRPMRKAPPAKMTTPARRLCPDSRGSRGRRRYLSNSRPTCCPSPTCCARAPLRRSLGGTASETPPAVLLQALSQFGVEARVIGMVVGPRVTRYELQLAPGTKVGKVSSLKDDLAYALASTEIRILAPIPGKSAVGVEVPNQRPDFVTLGDIYREFPKSAGPLMVWLGKDISGKAVYTDLTRLPHLLIAGTTGSGKSGCVNCLVSSVLLAQHARAGAHDHDRPQEGGALALRPHPSPAGPGGHQHEGRSRRPSQRGQGDGRPLRAHGTRARPQPARDEQGPGPPGRTAGALHTHRHRRVGRPDDGLATGGGGLCHPAGAEVPGGGHPPGGRHPDARRPTSSPA